MVDSPDLKTKNNADVSNNTTITRIGMGKIYFVIGALVLIPVILEFIKFLMSGIELPGEPIKYFIKIIDIFFKYIDYYGVSLGLIISTFIHRNELNNQIIQIKEEFKNNEAILRQEFENNLEIKNLELENQKEIEKNKYRPIFVYDKNKLKVNFSDENKEITNVYIYSPNDYKMIEKERLKNKEVIDIKDKLEVFVLAKTQFEEFVSYAYINGKEIHRYLQENNTIRDVYLDRNTDFWKCYNNSKMDERKKYYIENEFRKICEKYVFTDNIDIILESNTTGEIFSVTYTYLDNMVNIDGKTNEIIRLIEFTYYFIINVNEFTKEEIDTDYINNVLINERLKKYDESNFDFSNYKVSNNIEIEEIKEILRNSKDFITNNKGSKDINQIVKQIITLLSKIFEDSILQPEYDKSSSYLNYIKNEIINILKN